MYWCKVCKVGYCLRNCTIASSLGCFQLSTTAISIKSFKASPFVLSFGKMKSILCCLLIRSIILRRYCSCIYRAFKSFYFLSCLIACYLCFFSSACSAALLAPSLLPVWPRAEVVLICSFSAGFTVLNASSSM